MHPGEPWETPNLLKHASGACRRNRLPSGSLTSSNLHLQRRCISSWTAGNIRGGVEAELGRDADKPGLRPFARCSQASARKQLFIWLQCAEVWHTRRGSAQERYSCSMAMPSSGDSRSQQGPSASCSGDPATHVEEQCQKAACVGEIGDPPRAVDWVVPEGCAGRPCQHSSPPVAKQTVGSRRQRFLETRSV